MTKAYFFLVFLSIFLITSTIGQTEQQPNKDTCKAKVPNELSVKDAGTKLTFSCDCQLKSFEFNLLTRWGNLVYSTKVINDTLDFDMFEKVKTHGKEELKYKSGVYYWTAKYDAVIGNGIIHKTETGTIMIMND